MIIKANSENFKDVVQGEKVLVDFYADWCGPCKMLSPVLEEIGNERSSVKIVKVNVDEEESIAREYGIMSIPTLLLFENGALKKSQTGFLPKELVLEFMEKE